MARLRESHTPRRQIALSIQAALSEQVFLSAATVGRQSEHSSHSSFLSSSLSCQSIRSRGPIPAFASGCCSSCSKCRNLPDHSLDYISSGASSFTFEKESASCGSQMSNLLHQSDCSRASDNLPSRLPWRFSVVLRAFSFPFRGYQRALAQTKLIFGESPPLAPPQASVTSTISGKTQTRSGRISMAVTAIPMVDPLNFP